MMGDPRCNCPPKTEISGVHAKDCPANAPLEEAGEPASDNDLRNEILFAVDDMVYARNSHLKWAEHLEAHSSSGEACAECAEKPYKMMPEREREWVAKYDRVLRLLGQMRSTETAKNLWLSEAVATSAENEKLEERVARLSRERDEALTLGNIVANEAAKILNGQPVAQQLGKAILDFQFLETRKNLPTVPIGQTHV
jgi:hypothetical protein